MTLIEVQALTNFVRACLSHLDFDYPDQYRVGHDLLWLINHAGAAYEYKRLEEEDDVVVGRTNCCP